MPVRIGINGFGRIGRLFYRASLQNKEIEVVAVNDVAPAPTLAHLLAYDSIHGALRKHVKVEGGQIMVDGHAFTALSERDPANLPWRKLGVQLVVESTGKFRPRDKAALHLTAGARKVLISAPGENADITLCMGVNHENYDPRRHQVISNASCTTNCLAPVAKVLR